MNFSLAPNESIAFRHGVLIRSGIASPARVETAYQARVAEYHPASNPNHLAQ